MAMGDRVMVLNKGVVRQMGTPKDVYDDPADTFVATFLGSPPMNLIEYEDLIIGFRPEHFRLAEDMKETRQDSLSSSAWKTWNILALNLFCPAFWWVGRLTARK